MVGIVTFDDAIDVMEDEVTEDIAKMNAIMPGDNTYFGTSVGKHVKKNSLASCADAFSHGDGLDYRKNTRIC